MRQISRLPTVRGLVALLVVAVAGTGVFGVDGASAAVPATISGMKFSSDHAGTPVRVCDSSNPDARVMTVNWPGFVSFGSDGTKVSALNHVSGTVTMGPEVFTAGFATYGPPVSAITAVDLSFTVDRPGGVTVTGTIHLSALAPTNPPTDNFGHCTGLVVSSYAEYSATISDGTSSVFDQGIVTLAFVGPPQTMTFSSYADDHSAPTISPSYPLDGASYVVGEPVSSAFYCAEPLTGWGVSTCDLTVDGASVPFGGTIDTSTVGSHTFTIQTSDRGGNSASQTGSFNVTAGSATGDASVGYVTTNSTGFGSTPSVPVQTTVVVPCCMSGPISIALQPTPGPGGYSFFGKQVVVTGPEAASPYSPYQLIFSLDGSLLGTTPPESVQVYRNGTPVPDCVGTSGNVADPDPCVTGRFTNDDDLQVYVLTTGFSTWNFGPTVIATDTTPPTITPVLVGQLGTNGWYRGNVAVSWTVTDPESATTSTGCSPTQVTANTAGVTLTCSATSAGGSASKSVTIKKDASPPVVSFSTHPASYTVDKVVTIACTSSDALSGLATPCQPIDAPAYTFNIGTNTRTTTATDKAGNTTTSAPTTFTVTVTPGSLCTLTTQLTQKSAKYQALTSKQKQAVDALDKAACTIVQLVTPNLSAKAKAAQIALFKAAIAALVQPGWLTQSQADTLKSLTNYL